MRACYGISPPKFLTDLVLVGWLARDYTPDYPRRIWLPTENNPESGMSMQERAPQKPEPLASGPAVSSQDVEAELRKILASPLFRRSPT